MNEKIKKILNSKQFKYVKSLLTLDSDRQFIVSSMAYYFLLGLVPFIGLSSFVMNLFGIYDRIFQEIVIELGLSSYLIIVGKGFPIIFTSVLALYLSSKGLHNYFVYLNEKFELNNFRFSFITNKVYATIITLIVIILFVIFIFIISAISKIPSPINPILSSLVRVIFIESIIILVNYLLLKRKIYIFNLLLGSSITSILIILSSSLYQLILSFLSSKRDYYGVLSDVIILLFLIYLFSYFFALGNQINYLQYKRRGNPRLKLFR